MIVVTRLNGSPLALNCALIERVEETPDTVLTLSDGTKYVISESLEQIIERVRDFQASVEVAAQRLATEIDNEPNLRIVRDSNDSSANAKRDHENATQTSRSER